MKKMQTCLRALWLLVPMLHTGTILAADPAEPFASPATLDAVGGAPAGNAYALTLQGGWAFSALRVQAGLSERWALVSELESVLLLRNRPMVGVGVRLVDHKRIRITGEALVGWLFQRSEEIRRGPNGELRVRLALPLRRFVPYMVLGTRHAILPDRTTIERVSGAETSWSYRHEWTPWATLGVGFGISRAVGIDVGIDYGWVGAPDSIALPGIHAGIHFGGDR